MSKAGVTDRKYLEEFLWNLEMWFRMEQDIVFIVKDKEMRAFAFRLVNRSEYKRDGDGDLKKHVYVGKRYFRFSTGNEELYYEVKEKFGIDDGKLYDYDEVVEKIKEIAKEYIVIYDKLPYWL